MKRIKILFIILLVLLLVVCALAPPNRDQYTIGRIYIQSANVSAELTTSSLRSDCGCCGILWNGGVVTAKTNLSNVRLYDMAKLTTIEPSRIVLECVEITPCIRFGNWLISSNGIVQPNGDLLVVSGCIVYRFIML